METKEQGLVELYQDYCISQQARFKKLPLRIQAVAAEYYCLARKMESRKYSQEEKNRAIFLYSTMEKYGITLECFEVEMI